MIYFIRAGDYIKIRAYCFPAQAAVYSSGRAVLITPIRP